MDVYVEGPFGHLSIDLNWPCYEVVLLIGAGVGSAFTRSLFMHYLNAYENCSDHQAKIVKVVYVSIMRNVDLNSFIKNLKYSTVEVTERVYVDKPMRKQKEVPIERKQDVAHSLM
jgi:hypothetical protein